VTDRVEVLGVHFDNLTRRQAADAIVGLTEGGGKHYVVKPYSEFMPRAHSDPQIAALLNGAAFCLPDGVGILWAAHYLSLSGGTFRAAIQFPLSLFSLAFRPSALRKPLKQPMRGVDFTWKTLEAVAAAGLSVYLLGGTEKEVTGTAMAIRQRLSDLKILGQRNGYFKHQNEAVIAAINEAKPDLLLVAMGFPRQERWIADNLAALDIKVAVAEGGSFSFISGAASRAPSWMRRAGLEWLYRLARQPSRIWRQMALPRFVLLVFGERLRQ
jgi:N-acetylglucosaminyldiphosphoundecaprenol N-acetyl-beta-D-mannosaminyltransferase